MVQDFNSLSLGDQPIQVGLRLGDLHHLLEVLDGEGEEVPGAGTGAHGLVRGLHTPHLHHTWGGEGG